ncbi:MAG: NADH-quinone oxidoreductase subunit J [Proteobacteria bacterium]|nr:MAG: NADH-quinone oxidoreductase subunit J [Pseudomonadota bacterium]QKK12209.1 MAG: NADH-quinone oxidoreductase subunit J [Pseudomonadota bacterium]
MTLEQGIFFLFAAILVFAAFRVITARNPVHAAMFLVLCFVTSSAIWLLAEAEFLAITLVLVYVGAVMVLFLFVVMMLDINIDQLREGFMSYLPLGAGIAVVMVAEMMMVVSTRYFDGVHMPAPLRHGADYSNTRELGMILYTDYFYPFEIASVILLIAIVAAITLTLRRRPGTRHQDPTRQIAVRRADRVRLVKMEAEKKVES